MNASSKVIALEGRLRHCRNVRTLGVKTNFADYGPAEAALIRKAAKIYYPTDFYADLFAAMGKATFPSYQTYRFVQDKIKQSALFDLLGLPHPRTRVFYGPRQKRRIIDFFQFPFIAKVPRGSAMGRGVFLITGEEDLQRYLQAVHPAYIQEYLPIDRDMRVVIIGRHVAHAYWRLAPPREFRSNVSVGGSVRLDPVPGAALDLAIETARKCGWDDVGIDICRYRDRFYLLEANMKYGKEGFRTAGIDYIRLMEKLIEDEEI
jgi:ribosomal protein S6--L-glutamate ligase